MDDAGEVGVATAEHGLDPREQLRKIERLDEVVVRPQLEALDAIAGLVARAENDDPARAITGEGATELPAVDARHHQVEDDEVRLVLVDDAERDVTIRRGANVDIPRGAIRAR